MTEEEKQVIVDNKLKEDAKVRDRLQKQKYNHKVFTGWFIGLILLFTVTGSIYIWKHCHTVGIFEKVQKNVKGDSIINGQLFIKGDQKDTRTGYEYARLDADQEHTIFLIYSGRDDSSKSAFEVSSAATVDHVMKYLDNFYNNDIDPEQRKSILEYLSFSNQVQALSFLHGERLRVKSYFWLAGSDVYYEIMCWANFGVFCSLLYMLSDSHRTANQEEGTDDPLVAFEPKEIPYQLAKVFYAPTTVLIVIFGYNYISGATEIATSKGMLVIAFLGGFFSGRVMAFLNRIKEALLPISSSPTTTPTTKDAPNNGS